MDPEEKEDVRAPQSPQPVEQKKTGLKAAVSSFFAQRRKQWSGRGHMPAPELVKPHSTEGPPEIDGDTVARDKALSSGLRGKNWWLKVPVIFDPVDDRIRSRLLSALTISLMVCIAAVTVLNPQLGDTSLVVDSRDLQVSLHYLSSDSMVIGNTAATGFAIRMRLSNTHNWPFPDREVQVSVKQRRLAPWALAAFPTCSGSVGPDDEDSNQAARYAPVCQVILDGTTAMTNSDGVAEFSSLVFVAALPGSYQLMFTYSTATPEYVWIAVTSSVSSLTLISSLPSDAMSTHFFTRPKGLINSNFIPRVQFAPQIATQSKGGHYVVAVALNDLDEGGDTAVEESQLQSAQLLPTTTSSSSSFSMQKLLLGGVGRGHLGQIKVKDVMFEGNVAVTNDDGIAEFTNLQILATASPVFVLAFICEGKLLIVGETPLSHPAPPLTLGVRLVSFEPPYNPSTDPLRLLVIKQPPVQAVEGVEFSFVVQLVGASVQPSNAGRFESRSLLAFAEPVLSSFPTAVGLYRSDPFKTLHQAISLPIADDGTALFNHTHFSISGSPGLYRFRVVYDGELSILTDAVLAVTSVEEVLLTFESDSVGKCQVSQTSSCGFFRLLRRAEDGLPGAYAFNKTGYPIQGKRIEFTAQIAGASGGSSVPAVALDYDSIASDRLGLATLSFVTLSMQNYFILRDDPSRSTGPAFPEIQVSLLIDNVTTSQQLMSFRPSDLGLPFAAFSQCGVAICGYIRIIDGLPLTAVAGDVVSPSPRAQSIDLAGRTIPGRICLVIGTVEDPSLALQCVDTSATGLAVFDNLVLPARPDVEFSRNGVVLWRFITANTATATQKRCLQAQRVWTDVCGSEVRAIQIVPNSVTQIDLPQFSFADGQQYSTVDLDSLPAASFRTSLRVYCYGEYTRCLNTTISQKNWWPGASLYGAAVLPFNETSTVLKDPAMTIVDRLFIKEASNYFEFSFSVDITNPAVGTLVFTLECYGSSSALSFLHMRIAASAIELSSGYSAGGSSVMIGSPLPAVQNLRVTKGSAVAARVPVRATLVPHSSSASFQFGGSTVQCSNSNGVLGFTNLIISAATSGEYHLQFTVVDATPSANAASMRTPTFFVNTTVLLQITTQPSPFSASSSAIAFVQAPVVTLSASTSDGSADVFSTSWLPPLVDASLALVSNSSGLADVVPGGIQHVPIRATRVNALSAVATFSSLAVRSIPGNYKLRFSGAGLSPGGGQDSFQFLITSRPFRVEVLTSPPASVIVGRLFSMNVSVVTAAGVALAGVYVSAELDGSESWGDAQIVDWASGGDPGATTGEDGVGVMNLMFSKANPSKKRSIIFRCLDATSQPTAPIQVITVVTEIRLETAFRGLASPGYVDDNNWYSLGFTPKSPPDGTQAVYITEDDEERAASMVTPRISVYGSGNLQSQTVPHLSVSMRAISPTTGEDIGMSFGKVEENSPGVYDISDMRFPSTLRSSFVTIQYECEGVVITQNSTVYVRNIAFPETATIRRLRIVVVMGILLILPLMIANIAQREPTAWNAAPAIVCCILMIVFGVITLIWLDNTATFYGGFNGISFLMKIVVVLLVSNEFVTAFVLLSIVVTFWKPTYYTKRISSFRILLLRLLIGKKNVPVAPTDMRFKTAKVVDSSSSSEASSASRQASFALHDEPNGMRRRPEAQDSHRSNETQEENAIPEKSHRFENLRYRMRHFLSDKLIGPELEARAGRKSQEKPKAISGWSATREIVFPSRLVMGFVVSFVGVCITIAAMWTSLDWVVVAFGRVRSQIVAYRSQFEAYQSSFDPPASHIPTSVPAVPYLNRFDGWAILYSTLDAWYPRGSDLFENIFNGLWWANTISMGITMVAFLYSWLSTLAHYRRTMLLFRANSRHAADALNRFPLSYATFYVGFQLWSCVFSAALVYGPVMIILVCFFWIPVREAASSWWLPVTAVVLCEIFMGVYRFWIRSTAVHRNFITHRGRFALYDLVGLYLHLIGGVVHAVYRLIIAYADFAIAFGRLDMPLLSGGLDHLDPGHASYMAMILLDFKYNSPVPSVIVDILSSKLRERRENSKKSESKFISEERQQQMEESNQRRHHNTVRWRLLFSLWRSSILRNLRRSVPSEKKWTPQEGGMPGLGSVLSGARPDREGGRDDLESDEVFQAWADQWVHSQKEWDTAEGKSRRKMLPPHEKTRSGSVTSLSSAGVGEGGSTPQITTSPSKSKTRSSPRLAREKGVVIVTPRMSS